MRKKYTDETYLRGVSKYNVTTKEIKEQNAYIVIKEIIEIDKPFVKSAALMDNGFYIVEYTPILVKEIEDNKNIFINMDKKELIRNIHLNKNK